MIDAMPPAAGAPSADGGIPGQDLIEEARARQRRRRRWAAALAAVVAAGIVSSTLGLLLGGSGPATRAAGARAVSSGPFAGTWHVHTTDVTIAPSGHGTAQWPIHVRCGTSTSPGAPCDGQRQVPVSVPGGGTATADQIVDGGHADLVVVSVDGHVAHGIVRDSTDPGVLPDGPVTLRVDMAKDLLFVAPSAPTSSSPFGTSWLCGPRASARPLSRQRADGLSCD